MKLNKWFRRVRTHISWITAIVAAGTAIASVCLTFDTLKEMKIDRDNAYMPELVFEEEVYPIDTKALITKDQNDRIFVLGQEESPSYELRLLNIGVGIAKNVKVEMKEKDAINAANWLKETFEYGKWMKVSEHEDYSLFFYATDKNNIYGESTLGHNKEILYVLPEAKHECPLFIPDAYIGLSHKMYYIDDDTPQLSICVNWEDVKGKKYKKVYLLYAEDGWGHDKADMDAIEAYIEESSTGIYEDNICIKVKEK